jgi:hypothetical protein
MNGVHESMSEVSARSAAFIDETSDRPIWHQQTPSP